MRRTGGLLERRRTWDVIIALAATLLYAQSVSFGWVYDDQMEIVLNPLIRSLANLPTIFTTTVWAGSGMETYLYRPLALVTYGLNHVLSGLSPWSYHLVNVVLHAGMSILVFRLGLLWRLPLVGAGLGGLIFAVHPVHVEVVAAVFGRKDLLAGFFTLSMVLLHGHALRRGGWRLALPVTAYVCAMLSKEVGVAGLALVAAQDWHLSRNLAHLARDGRRAGLYVAYIGALLVYVLSRNAVTGGVGVPDTFYMDNPLVAVPVAVRWATALVVMGKGLLLQVAPLGLSPDYSFDAIPVVRSPLDWRFLATLPTLGLVAVGLRRWFRAIPSRPDPGRPKGGGPARSGAGSVPVGLFALATAWYLITILPTANLLVTVGTMFGERLLYLPSVAFSLLAGGLLVRLSEATRRSGYQGTAAPGHLPGVRVAAVTAAALWGGFLTYQAVRYSRAWRDDITLFRQAVASVPTSTKAQHKLGEELLRAGEIGEALPHLRRALEIAPDNEFAAQTLGTARERIARLYLPGAAGDAPSSSPPDDPEILYLLGQMAREKGDLEGAAAQWEAALAADSTHSPTCADLGTLELLQGNAAQALTHLRAAVRLDPGLTRAWLSLGRLYLQEGNDREARRALETFIDLAGDRFPDRVAWARETLARLPPR